MREEAVPSGLEKAERKWPIGSDLLHSLPCGSQRGLCRADQIVLVRGSQTSPCQSMDRPGMISCPQRRNLCLISSARSMVFTGMSASCFRREKRAARKCSRTSWSRAQPGGRAPYWRTRHLRGRILHGAVPSLAWRIEAGGKVLCLAGILAVRARG
jgi:hypothetical protein